MHRRRLIAAAALAVPALLPGRALWAKSKAGLFFAPGGVALAGADPVAYFTEGGPRPGRAELGLKWGGAVWLFSSEANRTRFEMDPRAHAPRYGGYCALSMAEGKVAGSVPEAWTIHEGRLYLNASLEFRELWRRDIAGYVALADSHWPGALG